MRPFLGGVLLILFACSGGLAANAPAETRASGPLSVDAGDLAEWQVIEASVGDERLIVALADDPDEWTQGLMGVDDFGDLDGMLFEFHGEQQIPVWMKDVLIPLDIAFFDGSRNLVEVVTMEPCEQDPCSRYVATAPFAWALETPAGRLGELPPDVSLTVGE